MAAVWGHVIIDDNLSLVSIGAIGSWGSVGSHLRVWGNASLDACHVYEVIFEELTYYRVNGTMTTGYNAGSCDIWSPE